MSRSPFDSDDAGPCADEELFTLYARYPEINFAPRKTSSLRALPDQLESSPLSHHDTGEEGSSRFSDSTSHTTPPRQILTRAMTSPGIDSLSGFFRLVRSMGFEKDWQQNFEYLGCTVVSISQALFSVPGLHKNPSLKPRFIQLCQELLRPISDASIRCEDHVWSVSRLKSLVAFNVHPTDEYLWSSYCERSKLVVRYAALATKEEKDVISAFTHLYNTQVYRRYLDLPDEENSDDDVSKALNELYDTIMTWETRYKNWWNHMVDLRRNYMLPLARRIHASPEILEELRQWNLAKKAARDLLNQPEIPSDATPAEATVIEARNLTSRDMNRDSSLNPYPKPPLRRQRSI